MSSSAPLIVTLSLDPHSFSFFNTLRQLHFPKDQNYLKAHLTLFHHLPADEPLIIDTIKNVAALQPILPLEVTDVVFIGNGVAYKVENKKLEQLHTSLQTAWKKWLTPQDQQRLWPHITVQNKVPSADARALQQQLKNNFTPLTAYGVGLSVWIYQGGPWKMLTTFPFTKEVQDTGLS